MFNRKLSATMGLVLGLVGISSTASAQWTAFPTPTNSGGAFWDNTSADGVKCNIGFVLSGTAGDLDCDAANVRPAGWLPFVGAKPQFFLGAGNSVGFLFEKGSYRISQLGSMSLGGDIAGTNNRWGVFEVGGPMTVLGTSGSPDIDQTIYFSNSWGLWIDLSRPSGETGYSNSASSGGLFQASLFSQVAGSLTGNTVDFNLNQTYYVGLENNACISRSQGPDCTILTDADYNDVLLAVTAVPEPSTYALVAAGLAAMMLASRRRRNV